MRENYRRILGIAVFYTAAVAIVDYFLAKTPMLSWLAFGLVFAFFAALLVDSVVRLRAKEELAASKIFHGHIDDLERLQEIVEKAMVQREPESLKILEKRLRSLAISALDHRQSELGRQGHPDAENSPQSVFADVETDLAAQLLESSSTVLKNRSSKDVESLLSEIEAWLS